jgi:ATP-dependent DNA helicase RecQ
MDDKHQILKQYFGYSKFRPLQAEIIDSLVAGNNALVLMPTGGGKSVCYQIPALLRPGMAIVVSPLIALMKDQVENLKSLGIAAAYLNSSQEFQEQESIMAEIRAGRLKLLYIAPEKIFQAGFLDVMSGWNISLLAIDESHCISSWGHDFRPEYLKLSVLREVFPDAPVVALTATADKVTRKDILVQLNMPEAETFLSSFDRPNISLTVLPGIERRKRIIRFIKDRPNQAGIVYCLSRSGTEDLAAALVKNGIKAMHYHAGCPPKYRSDVQEAFIKDEIQVMCATIAFGMGIDKSNIRWVMHYNVPGNIESYYQEIGRAGRDGMPATTLMFYAYSDMIIRREMIENSEGDETRKELKRAKLERLKQYCEAQICRRRILLSYFNEEAGKDCGNCDVCKNPRSKFNGNVLAQKALSAIARSEEKLTLPVLIDVLRGMRTTITVKNDFISLKTFGAGRDVREEDWMDFLIQMLNSGVMDIAYDDGHTLKLNALSWKILKENAPVFLVQKSQSTTGRDTRDTRTEKQKIKDKANDELFERLRLLRKQLAEKESVPPYVVFSDATLNDMVLLKPTNPAQMRSIHGMGEVKFGRYGQTFLRAICDFLIQNKDTGVRLAKGVTYAETLLLYEKGLDVEAIAGQRNFSPITIATHLIKLRDSGETIDLKKFIQKKSLDLFETTLQQMKSKAGKEEFSLQELSEVLHESMPAWELRLIYYCHSIE